MNLKNIPHLDWLITLIAWVVAIVAFNPYLVNLLLILFGAFLFIWLLQIRNKNKIKHSRDLVKDFLNPEVSFNQVKGSLALEVKPYSIEINEHLEDAHKDIKEMIERRNIYIKLYNQELKEYYSNLQDNILRCIEKKFIRYDYSRSGVGQINFFNTEFESDILGIIRRNCQSPELSFKINPHDRFYDLVCTYNQTIWIMSDNLDELKETEKNIINIFNNSIKTKLKFKLLLCYYDKIKAYQTSINRELNQIIDSIRNKATPLKGKCSTCLKENFFGDIYDT